MNWEQLRTVLGKKLGAVGQVTITPAVLMTILIIIAGTYWASRLLQRMLRRNVFGRLGLREGTKPPFATYFTM